MKIESILSPAEIALLPERPLGDATCVVFDILRATSTMTTAFAHGAASIRPVLTVEEALAVHQSLPTTLLAGERGGEKIEGFDFGNSPLEFIRCSGREIVATTTNGTVALRAVAHAQRVLAGALLNMGALVAAVEKSERLVLVAAGTGRTMALEDVLAVGMLARALREKLGAQGGGSCSISCCDATLAAIAVFEQGEPDFENAFRQSANGRALLARGYEADVAWCAQAFRFQVVGEMRGGALWPIHPISPRLP